MVRDTAAAPPNVIEVPECRTPAAAGDEQAVHLPTGVICPMWSDAQTGW